jgi:hypothetical protein
MSKKKNISKQAKVSPVLIAVFIIIAIITAVALFSSSPAPQQTNEPTAAEQAAGVPLSSDAIKDLGRALFIGDSIMNLNPEGTTVIKPDAIAGMDNVLQGRDVTALERLLKKKQH